MIAHKRTMNKKAAYFGSYGWSKGAHRECLQITEKLHWEWTDVFEFAGGATKEQLHEAEAFGQRFAELVARD